MPVMTPEPYKLGSATRTSSTPSGTPKWRPTGSRTFGDELLLHWAYGGIGPNHQPLKPVLPALEGLEHIIFPVRPVYVLCARAPVMRRAANHYASRAD